jgi:uncharacterized membrane protein HdeD (DUF308 family)
MVFQGVLTLLFGVAVVFWPGLTLAILIYLVGAYLLVSGIGHVFVGLSNLVHEKYWFLNTVLGLAEVGFGIYVLRHPHETFTLFIGLLGFILIIRGVIQLVTALLDTSGEMNNRGMTVFMGLFAAVVGIIILDQKVAAGIAFVWVLGVYAIVAGLIELMAARSLES